VVERKRLDSLASLLEFNHVKVSKCYRNAHSCATLI
jgi:hypothetical protein